MLDFLFYLIEPVLWLFAWAFAFDDRPSVRLFTLGCLVVILLLVVAGVGAYFLLR
ncbi:MAG TPA: hypothetical protein VFA26_13565 [Gemmataceae bacterium]|nr:hypothetical protein [Gemmataceae bacterium]